MRIIVIHTYTHHAHATASDLVALTWRRQVIRIQPDEAIYLRVNNKVPGLGLRLGTTKLDLTYRQRYDTALPDAYERLILDVINGDKRLFIRNDELEVGPGAPQRQIDYKITRSQDHKNTPTAGYIYTETGVLFPVDQGSGGEFRYGFRILASRFPYTDPVYIQAAVTDAPATGG